MVPQLKPIKVRVWDCKHLSWSWVWSEDWGHAGLWSDIYNIYRLAGWQGVCLDTNIITHQASLRIGIYYLRLQWPSFPLLSLPVLVWCSWSLSLSGSLQSLQRQPGFVLCQVALCSHIDHPLLVFCPAEIHQGYRVEQGALSLVQIVQILCSHWFYLTWLRHANCILCLSLCCYAWKLL